MSGKWTSEKINKWIESQKGDDSFYQTIVLNEGLIIKGRVNSIKRLKMFNLPDKLDGYSVLDIGCNSGSLCFEVKKRGAQRVVGIDIQKNRLLQAKTIAEILDLEVDFKELSLFKAAELGKFDIVFCIAVLTEVTDLIRGLEVVKQVANDILYLEIATDNSCCRKISDWGFSILSNNKILQKLFPKNYLTKKENRYYGIAKLRKINSRSKRGWSLVPNKQFIYSIMADKFSIYDLGQSERYNLFKLVRKSRAEQ